MSEQMPEIEAPEHPQHLLAPPGEAPSKVTVVEKRPSHRPRGWVYAAILVILAVAGLFWWYEHAQSAASAKAKSAAAAGIPVVAAQAVTGNIGVYVTGLGAITPIYTVTVKSRVNGQLMTVHFKEGDLVNQGDLLIEIDPRPYEAAVVQAQGALVRDTALLANARVDLIRYTTLVAQDAEPEQVLATQRALVAQYEGTVTNDQGVLDAAKVNVVYCHITSPITGIVGLRLVDPGNIVQSTDSNGMIVITQIQPISVIFTVGEDQLPPILRPLRRTPARSRRARLAPASRQGRR